MKLLEMGVARVNAVPMRDSCYIYIKYIIYISQGRVGQLPPPRPPRPSGIPSRIRALHLIDACAHPWSFHDSDPTKFTKIIKLK